MDTKGLIETGQFVDPGGDESLWCACELCGQELKYSEAMSHALMHQKMKVEDELRKAVFVEATKRSTMDQKGSAHVTPNSEIFIRSASVESTDSGISMNGTSTDLLNLVNILNSSPPAMTMTLNYQGNINTPAQPQVVTQPKAVEQPQAVLQPQAKKRGRKPKIMDGNNITKKARVSKSRESQKKILKNVQILQQVNVMNSQRCNGMTPHGNPYNCPNAVALRLNQPPPQVAQNYTHGGPVYCQQQQFNQQPSGPPRHPSIMSQMNYRSQLSRNTAFQKPPPPYSQVCYNSVRQQHYQHAPLPSTRDEWQSQSGVSNLHLSQMQQMITGPSSSQYQSRVQQTKQGAWNGQHNVQNNVNSSQQQRPTTTALPDMQSPQYSLLGQQQQYSFVNSAHQLSPNSGSTAGPSKLQSILTNEMLKCPSGNSSTPVPRQMAEAVYDDSLIFNCEFCSQLFKTEDEISDHLRVDHRIPKKYRWCRTCGLKVEADERTLRQHIWEVHGV